MTSESNGSITSVLQETRVFPPPPEFAAKRPTSRSLEQYQALWNRAKDDPEGFWGEQAKSLTWFKPWDKVLEWNPPFAKWFVGGQLNASYNCVDRHCDGPNKNKAALDLGRRAGRAPGAPLSGPPARGLASSPTSSRAWASRRGTSSRSTCR